MSSKSDIKTSVSGMVCIQRYEDNKPFKITWQGCEDEDPSVAMLFALEVLKISKRCKALNKKSLLNSEQKSRYSFLLKNKQITVEEYNTLITSLN